MLPQSFYLRETIQITLDLMGKVLCFKDKDQVVRKGRISEAEAYLGLEDPAAHSFGGKKTGRVSSMYLDGGHAYVYLIYGMYHCLNVVTQSKEEPEAVLIRALWPVGKEVATAKELSGPGKLCRSFGIDLAQNGLALFDPRSPLWIEDDGYEVAESEILTTPRIGLNPAKDSTHWPLRFVLVPRA